MTASDGIQIEDLENSLNIESQQITLDRNKNILTASDGIQIEDIENTLNIESEQITKDRNKNIIKTKRDLFWKFPS